MGRRPGRAARYDGPWKGTPGWRCVSWMGHDRCHSGAGCHDSKPEPAAAQCRGRSWRGLHARAAHPAERRLRLMHTVHRTPAVGQSRRPRRRSHRPTHRSCFRGRRPAGRAGTRPRPRAVRWARPVPVASSGHALRTFRDDGAARRLGDAATAFVGAGRRADFTMIASAALPSSADSPRASAVFPHLPARPPAGQHCRRAPAQVMAEGLTLANFEGANYRTSGQDPVSLTEAEMRVPGREPTAPHGAPRGVSSSASARTGARAGERAGQHADADDFAERAAAIPRRRPRGRSARRDTDRRAEDGPAPRRRAGEQGAAATA